MRYDIAFFFEAETDDNARAFLAAVLGFGERMGITIELDDGLSLSNVSTGKLFLEEKRDDRPATD